MDPEISPTPIKSPAKLLFCDNLALYYLVERTPLSLLARLFCTADPRLAGALLGVMDMERRREVHQLMSSEKDGNQKLNKQALDALLIIANDLCLQGLIYRRGIYFLGKRQAGLTTS